MSPGESTGRGVSLSFRAYLSVNSPGFITRENKGEEIDNLSEESGLLRDQFLVAQPAVRGLAFRD